MTSKIQIVARLRPRLSTEGEDDNIHVAENSVSVVNPRDASQRFKFQFTHCYDQASTQEEIFANNVQPMIDLVYQGLTLTIFAYGVTSSGKTHTMQGSKSQPGVIPRTAIFRDKDNHPFAHISIRMAYMEIYKDDVFDLLVSRENAPKLPVRENEHGKVFVANLTYEPISDFADFDALYSRATKHRSVGATNLNHASSRSHAILLIQVSLSDPSLNKTLTGTINLVDLAGSENNKLTGNDPSRMAESAAINKSLSVLGQVVHALNSNQSRIPYRNSKLTRILQDALGGSSVGLLICNLAPGAKFRQDTLNTLNFAVRTKNIENKPLVNEQENRPKPTFQAPAIPQQRSNSHSRQSLLPPPKIPRVSAVAHGGPAFQPLALQPKQEPNTLGLALTEAEFNDKVAKAVQAEVAKRMEEMERQRQQEEQAKTLLALEREREAAAARRQSSDDPSDAEKENRALQRTQSKSRSPKKEPGSLSPLLKRHKELDGGLRARLQELEQRFERSSSKDAPDVLSPVSKKKIGRAYVAAARSYSEKGDLQAALELYRKAETYVPDNIKLKERIIEIDWAVKNHRPFAPSPKPKKATRTRTKKAGSSSSSTTRRGRSKRNASTSQSDEEQQHQRRRDEDADYSNSNSIGQRRGGSGGGYENEFGVELTNNKAMAAAAAAAGSKNKNSPGRFKRSRSSDRNDDDGEDDDDNERGEDDDDERMETTETPVKKLRRSARGKKMKMNVVVVGESDEEDEDEYARVQAPVKKGKRRAMPY